MSKRIMKHNESTFYYNYNLYGNIFIELGMLGFDIRLPLSKGWFDAEAFRDLYINYFQKSSTCSMIFGMAEELVATLPKHLVNLKSKSNIFLSNIFFLDHVVDSLKRPGEIFNTILFCIPNIELTKMLDNMMHHAYDPYVIDNPNTYFGRSTLNKAKALYKESEGESIVLLKTSSVTVLSEPDVIQQILSLSQEKVSYSDQYKQMVASWTERDIQESKDKLFKRLRMEHRSSYLGK